MESVETLGDLWWLKIRGLMFMLLMLLMLSITALIGLIAQLFTLGRARRFCLNYLGPMSSQILLWLVGIRVQFHGFEDLPESSIVIGNHSSTLDLLIVTMLPVPNKRSFMKRRFRIFLPLAIIGLTNGIIFTPPQSYPKLRVKCFKRAERILRESGDSCFLSVEGTRWTTPKVGPFNKGAFHLATVLGYPILPVYIDIPREMNPGVGFKTRPGVINVYARPIIDTSQWKVDDAALHKEETREIYLKYPEGWKSV